MAITWRSVSRPNASSSNSLRSQGIQSIVGGLTGLGNELQAPREREEAAAKQAFADRLKLDQLAQGQQRINNQVSQYEGNQDFQTARDALSRENKLSDLENTREYNAGLLSNEREYQAGITKQNGVIEAQNALDKVAREDAVREDEQSHDLDKEKLKLGDTASASAYNYLTDKAEREGISGKSLNNLRVLASELDARPDISKEDKQTYLDTAYVSATGPDNDFFNNYLTSKKPLSSIFTSTPASKADASEWLNEKIKARNSTSTGNGEADPSSLTPAQKQARAQLEEEKFNTMLSNVL